MIRFMWWAIMHYRWCGSCGQKRAESKSELCPTCNAELAIALEKILAKER